MTHTGETEKREEPLDVKRQPADETGKSKKTAGSCSVSTDMFSDELRNPTHWIIHYSQFGLKRSGTNDKLHHYFSEIHSAGRRLVGVIDQLATLNELKSGNYEVRHGEIDLGTLFQGVCSEYESALNGKGLRVHWFVDDRVSLKVRGDSFRLAQLARNIFDNAIRYSEANTLIKVGLSNDFIVDETGCVHAAVKFNVADQGRNIPENEVERLFDLMPTSEATTAKRGRSGLGLCLCREIVKAHHGRIWAEPNPKGQGAVFNVLIPKQGAHE